MLSCAEHPNKGPKEQTYLIEFFAYETIGIPTLIEDETRRFWLKEQEKYQAQERIASQIQTLATARS